MPSIRNVISTLTPEGEEVMGLDILMWHYPDNSIMNGSLLTVESNHFCVLKSRGAILNVYETGQYPGVVSAPNMAVGLPFNISGVQPTASTDRYTAPAQIPPAPAQPAQQVPPRR